MNITRETDYAVRCVLYLAKHSDAIAIVDDIAAEMDIPKSFLAKILQKLAKAGIVKSTRGVRGGFRLAMDPSGISLLRVIEAIQGPLCLNICLIDEKHCRRTSFCSVHPAWIEIQKTVEKELRSYDFGKFMKSETGKAVRP
jgi:Rrf2 family protein